MYEHEPVESEMSIGENIKRKRENSKVSQKALAEALGIAENTIASWEKGKNIPPSDKVIVMAQFFQCSTDEILLDEGNRDVTEDVKALFRRYNDLDNKVKPMARNILNGVLSGLEMSQDSLNHGSDQAWDRLLESSEPIHTMNLSDWGRDPEISENEGLKVVENGMLRKPGKVGKA